MEALTESVRPALHYATLSNWLYLVACLRLLSVYLGYSYPAPVMGQTLQSQLFASANSDKKKDGPARQEFTPLAGRTFAVWTAVTCAVCIVTARNPGNVPLLQLCTGTFGFALGYFALEYSVYKTVTLQTVLRPAFFAGACRTHLL